MKRNTDGAPPMSMPRPKRARNGTWESSRLFVYLRELEQYADYLEWRLKHPQQEPLRREYDGQ